MVGWFAHGKDTLLRSSFLATGDYALAARITSKGRVTIPAEIRKRAGLLPGTEVDIEFDGRAVRIVPSVSHNTNNHGANLVAHLRGCGDVAMSTDSIMALTRDL
jgi:AbrB family looped-hinge helix DNA binding protein